MLTGLCLGSNDLEKAGKFYDVVLKIIGMERLLTLSNEIGYGYAGQKSVFYILAPYNKKPASFGNGTQVMFGTDCAEKVQAFYDAALSLGGTDEGAPGPRDYAPDYYGAYLRDPDGNKIHIHKILSKD